MDVWSSGDNEVTVDAYFDMLAEDLLGQSYVKKRVYERVAEQIGRSPKAVEWKFQNISAALQRLHAPWIEGLLPAKNFQESLTEVVAGQLEKRSDLLDLMARDVQSPAVARIDYAWDVIAPPWAEPFVEKPPSHVGLHTDFVRMEAANRSLGLSGEELVVARERQLLTDADRPDLAARVEHVSRTHGDGLGYDVGSFTPDGSPRLIEVKTTRRGKLWPMFVSRNEVAVSRDLRDHYVLARVFHFNMHRVGLYELAGAIEQTCWLQPETYKALPRVS